MSTRQVTMTDTLSELKEGVIDGYKDLIRDYIKENPEVDDIDAMNDNGCVNELVDGWVPIYYHELEGNYYLYSSELDEAYDNAGCYAEGERPENYQAVCHYFLLEETIHEWAHDNAVEFIEDLKPVLAE